MKTTMVAQCNPHRVDGTETGIAGSGREVPAGEELSAAFTEK